MLLPLASSRGYESDTRAGGDEAENHLHMVGLVRCIRGETGLPARREEGVVKHGHRIARRKNERLVGQCGQRDTATAGEPMARGQSREERFGNQHFAGQHRIVDRRAHEADIESPLPKRGELRRNRDGPQFYLKFLMFSVEFTDQQRDADVIHAIADANS
jgi:hypothetical protein